MTSYLLLRNNKESGPYSLDEIVRLGLKAYDLVWVNGKSAAWRYPGEITELQPYAPAVEEQPYDRFYKKNTEESKVSEHPKQSQVSEVKQVTPAPEEIKPIVPLQEVKQVLVDDAPLQEEIKPISRLQEVKQVLAVEEEPTLVKEEIAVTGHTVPAVDQKVTSKEPVVQTKKSVFVTMPKGRAPVETAAAAAVVPVVAPNPTPAVPAQHQPAAFEKYMPAGKTAAEPVDASAPSKTITITENPVTAEIKYSQPLDEIKEMYVKTLQERKQRIANKAFILQTLKKVAVVIAIVGAGILIGFTMKSNAGKKLVAASESIQQPVSDQNVNSTTAPETATTEESLPEANTEEQEQLNAEPQVNRTSVQSREPARNEIIPEQKAVAPPATQKAIMPEPISPDLRTKEEVVTEVPVQNAEVNERTGERTRKVRSSTEQAGTPPPADEPGNEKPAEPRNETKAVVNKSLMSQVSVKTNNYQIVAFGGIRDLQLTLYNDSKYVLDKVLVELQYLKPSEEPLRIDVITFKSVSPNGSLTIRMPDTNRGIKVRYRILNILSTQSARDMADL